MTTIAYTCPFIPAEWITAHGLQASRIVPISRGHGELMETTKGLCPFARAFLNDLACRPAKSPAVFTTVCDQMRRAAEVFTARCPDRPCFVMNVPATWRTPAAMDLYVDELRRLTGFLIRLGGQLPTDEKLTEVMLAYDDAREQLRAARYGLTARRYAQLLADFAQFGLHALDTRCQTAQADHKSDAVPLAIVGGPLIGGHFEVFDIVERFGGRIVLNATAGSELTFPAPLDRRKVSENPLAALAEAYFGTIPHAMRRPDSMLHDYLAREFAARGIRGILLHRQLWCDLWHGQLPRVKQQTDLPVLDLDIADEEADFGRQASKLQAFMEMLGGEEGRRS